MVRFQLRLLLLGGSLVALAALRCGDALPTAEAAEQDINSVDSDTTTVVAELDAAKPTIVDAVVQNASTVRFIAVGDTGKGNEGQYQLGAALGSFVASHPTDFVLLLGDNIYESGASSSTDPQFGDKFEKPYATVDVPFYVALGNHDYGGKGFGNEFRKPNNEIEYSKVSKKWRLPARHYQLNAGPISFFIADTNRSMYGVDQGVRRDLKSLIQQSKAKWKIGVGHHPYLSNGPHGNAGRYDGMPLVPVVNGKGVKSFVDDIFCGKTALYLSAHDHNMQWHQNTCRGTELIVSGAGAQPTPLGSKNPTHFQASELGFVYIQGSDATLTLQFIGLDGKVRFERVVRK